MPGPDAYRDELAAAQARIAELERVAAERSVSDANTSALMALMGERVRAAAATEPRNVLRMTWPMFVVFGVVGVVFAVERDWLFAPLALVAPFCIALVGQKIANGSADAAKRQVVLIDERLAKLRTSRRATQVADRRPRIPSKRRSGRPLPP